MPNPPQYPTSAIQQQFWLIAQLHPETSAYNVPSVFRLRGAADIPALESSLRALVSQHPILRTRFISEGGKLQQEVLPQADFSLTRGDVVAEQAGLDAAIRNAVKREVTRPFDLSTAPLMRATLLRVAENDHVLVLVMHHIIFDLRSKDLFAEGFASGYAQRLKGEAIVFDAPGPAYADYALWQQDWMDGPEHKSMLSFWKQHLAEQQSVLDFPTDATRPAVQALAGDALPVEIGAELALDVERFARDHQVNAYLVLQSAYIVLLNRYSGQSDVTIGVPLSNRRRVEFKDTMGCFVHTVPLALRLNPNETFVDTLRSVRRAMLGAHRNQEAPFESIVAEVPTARGSGGNPLFQFGFTFEHPMSLALEGLSVESMPTHCAGAQLDVFATFWKKNDSYGGLISYDSALFAPDTIARLFDNYSNLLSEIIRDPDAPLSSVEILSRQEKARLLQQWNDTARTVPEIRNIHGLFERQAAETPEAIAVAFEDEQLSYEELNRQANRLARNLVRDGVQPNGLVGVFMERSIEMVVCLLGVLKTGAAYIPIDPKFPKDRIAYMIEHSGVAAVVSQAHLRESIPESNATVLTIDSSSELAPPSDALNPENTTQPDDLAYVIYTSGSTGKPKGVQVHHGAVTNFLCSMGREPGLSADDVLLAVTTLSFDIAVLEIYLPLITGAKTVIASHAESAEGSSLLQAIRKHGVTVMQATPATWRLMIAAGWTSEEKLKVLCGGEALPADLAEQISARSPNAWNMYGPTETTVWSTCCKVVANSKAILVGRPIDNTSIYILDAHMQPVPIGATGNLFIGGLGVTKGYLHRPDLTEARFVPDPFDMAASGPIYDTGDLARYHGDGSIELLGRSDFQVKINGFRVETGEIESVLGLHPAVEQAIASIHEFAAGDFRLVAHYSTKDGSEVSVTDLRTHLSSTLPAYMIPAVFILVDAMPLTPNGKVDRKRLPKPENKRSELSEAYVPPEDDLEKTLSELWCAILKVPRVGVNDRFFDIGGTSLLGVQLIERIRETHGRDIPMTSLFQYPTIRTFGSYLNADGGQQNMDDTEKKARDRASARKDALSRMKQSRGRRRPRG